MPGYYNLVLQSWTLLHRITYALIHKLYLFVYISIYLFSYFSGMWLPLFSGFVWSAVIWKTTFPYFFPTVTHQSMLEFTPLIHVDSHCAGHLIVLFTEPDFFMAAGPVIYFHIYIHSLHWYGKFSLMQTNLKTFISLTSIVLSPFCINSVHGKVPVLSIITCPNYTMQFLVRTGAIMRNMGILI